MDKIKPTVSYIVRKSKTFLLSAYHIKVRVGDTFTYDLESNTITFDDDFCGQWYNFESEELVTFWKEVKDCVEVNWEDYDEKMLELTDSIQFLKDAYSGCLRK
jgi:hypothetical protein